MKILTKVTIGLATATLLLVGCNETAKAKPQEKAQVKPIID
ncbi:MAG TPA: nitrate reductase, partial [Campylobacterales bacterium]|nr:nitrate reductase [Campylobacterales bacterium]